MTSRGLPTPLGGRPERTAPSRGATMAFIAAGMRPAAGYSKPLLIRARRYSAARMPDCAVPSMKSWKLWKLSVCPPADARLPQARRAQRSIVVKQPGWLQV
jgi:hypothetical protein